MKVKILVVASVAVGCGSTRHPPVQYPRAEGCRSPAECMTLGLAKFEEARALQKQALDSLAMTVPPGTVAAFAGVMPPSGWLLCNGDVIDPVSKPQYQALHNAIGELWGDGGDGRAVPRGPRTPCSRGGV